MSSGHRAVVVRTGTGMNGRVPRRRPWRCRGHEFESMFAGRGRAPRSPRGRGRSPVVYFISPPGLRSARRAHARPRALRSGLRRGGPVRPSGVGPHAGPRDGRRTGPAAVDSTHGPAYHTATFMIHRRDRYSNRFTHHSSRVVSRVHEFDRTDGSLREQQVVRLSEFRHAARVHPIQPHVPHTCWRVTRT